MRSSLSEGERIRAREMITRLRSTIDSIAKDIATSDIQIGLEPAQALITTSTLLVMTLARLDAYQHAEKE